MSCSVEISVHFGFKSLMQVISLRLDFPVCCFVEIVYMLGLRAHTAVAWKRI